MVSEEKQVQTYKLCHNGSFVDTKYSQLCISLIHWNWRNSFELVEKIWLTWDEKKKKIKKRGHV